MRSDAEPFRSRNAGTVKYPRIVVKIEFEVESIFLTSHDDISNLPGDIILGVLQDPAATSQKIVPDEARSEIGSFSFSLIDKDSAFTEGLRTRLLDDGYGLRGKKVQLYIGYAGFVTVAGSAGYAFGAGAFGSHEFGGSATADEQVMDCNFDDFGLFQTQIVTGIQFDAGVYKVQCKDITREQREDIFEPKTTNLAQELTDSATTVEVYDTSNFTPIAHGTSYSDSPSATVGYFKIDKEIIKYTAKTLSQFTGCTRGALNTKAAAHTFESTAAQDRRPKVEEYIYLEEPCAALAYKILTGKDALTGLTVWPDHWHMGISTSLVRLADFTGIGADLWDTTDATLGFVAYFTGLKKVTGKQFIESEIYVLLGCYSPIYADGTIGLKRMNHVLADSASVITLNENNCVSWSELRHEYGMLHNRIRIDWNWNGEEFTRTNLFIDETSVELHKDAPVKTYQFKGLHGARHTDSIVRTRIDAIRDRYSQPPQTISVSVLPSLNILELGDIARVNLSQVRDFAAEGDNINRSFEIQQGSYNWATGNVSFDLFGSTARAETRSPTDDSTSLPDTFYTDRGTDLSSVTTISVVGGVGVIQPGTYNLTGNADVNNSAAIYYYNGDLQLGAGATLTVNNNVQIRHNGFFQINGTIDGIGRGQSGVADGSSDPYGKTQGTQGFVGNSRGMDGLAVSTPILLDKIRFIDTLSCAFTTGKYSAVPYFDLTIDGDDIIGIPADLRGTSGGAGGKTLIGSSLNVSRTISSNGGSGADSGAGLVLVGKGVGFGGAGLIDLSGDDSATTTADTTALPGFTIYPGAGGSGSPGSLMILIDGADVSLPDVTGHFTALCGTVPVNGNPLSRRSLVSRAEVIDPVAGYLDESLISDVDLSSAAHRIQYLPAVQTPEEDTDKPAAPTALSVAGSIGKLTLNSTVDLNPGERIEYYAAITNDRTGATRIGFGAQTEFVYSLATGGTRYVWARVRRVQPGVDLFSEFYPSSPTGGLAATVSTVDTDDIAANAVTATYSASDSGPDTYNAGTIPPPPNYYLSVSGVGVPAGSVLRATLMCSGSEATPGSRGSMFMILDWGAANQQSDSARIADQTEQSYNVQKEFSALPASTAWTLTVRINESATASTTYTDTSVLIEVIKR